MKQEKFVNCDACDAIAPVEVSVEKYRVPLQLTRYAQVIGWPDIQEQCSKRHAVDLDAIQAGYTIERRISCSFPGGHEHKGGYIARSRCGLMLRLGHTCAENSVSGFKAMVAFAKRGMKFRGRLSSVTTSPAEITEELARLAPRHAAILRKRDETAQAFWRKHVRNIAYEGGRKREYVLTKSRKGLDGKIVREQTTVILRGLDFWKRCFDQDNFAAAEGEAKSLVAAVATGSELKEIEVNALYGRAQQLRQQVTAMLTWVAEGEAFFEHSNLATVIDIAHERR